MRVLFPFVGDSVGGSHRSAIELIKGLRKKNVEVFVVLHEEHGPLSKLLHSENVIFQVMNTSVLAGESPRLMSVAFGMLINLGQFRKFLLENTIDIVHGNDLRVNLSWSFATKFSSAYFVWHQRTLLSSSPSWHLIRYLCDSFIAISNEALLTAPTNLKANQKKIILNPVAAENFDKDGVKAALFCKYKIPKDSILLGYMGRLVEYKRVDFLIDCFSRLCLRNDKKLHLVIFGSGKSEYVSKLKWLVKKYSIEDKVTFTGFIENPNEMIAGLDILLAASLIDAFGRTLVEAMLQRVPVLAACSGGHLDVIEHGVNGYLFKADNCSDFNNKLILMIKRSQDLRGMLEVAYQQAKVKYSVDSHASSVLDTYAELLSLH